MSDYKNPNLKIDSSKIEGGSFSWKSPSNLAIIKYWGKHGIQLPRNPSISFTLESAFTHTLLEYQPKNSSEEGVSLDFISMSSQMRLSK